MLLALSGSHMKWNWNKTSSSVFAWNNRYFISVLFHVVRAALVIKSGNVVNVVRCCQLAKVVHKSWLQQRIRLRRRVGVFSTTSDSLEPVAARGEGARGQMTWLKGFRPGCRPGFRPDCHFFLLKEKYVYRRAHKTWRSFCQFADSKNVK